MDGSSDMNSKQQNNIKTGMMLTQHYPSGHWLQLMKQQNFDFVIFDGEHGAFSIESLTAAFTLCKALHLKSIVRVPQITYEWFAPLLDAGADGLMVPRLRNWLQVLEVLSFCTYPPHGQRGVASGRQHCDFVCWPPGEVHQKRRPMLWLQVESLEFLKELQSCRCSSRDEWHEWLNPFSEDVAASCEVTFFMGPTDLTRSFSVSSPELAQQVLGHLTPEPPFGGVHPLDFLTPVCQKSWDWIVRLARKLGVGVALQVANASQAARFVQWHATLLDSCPTTPLPDGVYLSVGSDMALVNHGLACISQATKTN